jgi:hypothetical protein
LSDPNGVRRREKDGDSAGMRRPAGTWGMGLVYRELDSSISEPVSLDVARLGVLGRELANELTRVADGLAEARD